MIYDKNNHECIYGVTDKGKEMTESFISEASISGDGPIYKKGKLEVFGTVFDWFDERRNLARIYKYCPLCGKKLNKNTIMKTAENNYIY